MKLRVLTFHGIRTDETLFLHLQTFIDPGVEVRLNVERAVLLFGALDGSDELCGHVPVVTVANTGSQLRVPGAAEDGTRDLHSLNSSCQQCKLKSLE